MTEATWNDDAKTPSIDWRMSASLENVPRGDKALAEVTSLEGAVRAWQELDDAHREAAVLSPSGRCRSMARCWTSSWAPRSRAGRVAA